MHCQYIGLTGRNRLEDNDYAFREVTAANPSVLLLGLHSIYIGHCSSVWQLNLKQDMTRYTSSIHIYQYPKEMQTMNNKFTSFLLCQLLSLDVSHVRLYRAKRKNLTASSDYLSMFGFKLTHVIKSGFNKQDGFRIDASLNLQIYVNLQLRLI